MRRIVSECKQTRYNTKEVITNITCVLDLYCDRVMGESCSENLIQPFTMKCNLIDTLPLSAPNLARTCNHDLKYQFEKYLKWKTNSELTIHRRGIKYNVHIKGACTPGLTQLG